MGVEDASPGLGIPIAAARRRPSAAALHRRRVLSDVVRRSVPGEVAMPPEAVNECCRILG